MQCCHWLVDKNLAGLYRWLVATVGGDGGRNSNIGRFFLSLGCSQRPFAMHIMLVFILVVFLKFNITMP